MVQMIGPGYINMSHPYSENIEFICMIWIQKNQEVLLNGENNKEKLE